MRNVFLFRRHYIFTLLTWCCSGHGANASIFESHTTFPGIPRRKRLLEIVWEVSWVFGECPVAVRECCRQDIVSKRERSTFLDLKVYSVFSPETKQKTKDVRKRTVHAALPIIPDRAKYWNLLFFFFAAFFYTRDHDSKFTVWVIVYSLSLK